MRRQVTDPDLFSDQRAERRRANAPLAARMRPANLDEVVGQQGLLAPGAAFRTMVEAGRPVSMILWGPPGSGKTTLARLVAANSSARFEQLSATSAGVKEVREVLAMATRRIENGDGRTVLFLDEIHRFTKAQQDALLPGVEDGLIILVGATTENPFFEVNSPLISRSSVFRTEELAPDEVKDLIRRAMTDPARGIPDVAIDDDALEDLAHRVGGDARLALNGFELAVTIAEGRGRDAVGREEIAEALQRRVIRYDKGGDRHYDVISAFIKSVRGSDVDAALYWLHTMIGAGEDPKFIARRLVILASEDIGLADSRGLGIAVDAFRAVEVIGIPEGAYALTHATVYLATAPKSNSLANAITSAREIVEGTPGADVPMHLRSGATAGERAMGHGGGYRYPHDDPLGVVPQQYLPDEAIGAALYRPGDHGEESEIRERLGRIDRILGRRR
jgi:putative ATPase